MPQSPHDFGLPVQAGPASLPLPLPEPPEANAESCFVSFVEPHFGHWAPFHFVERTRISESAPHLPQ